MVDAEHVGAMHKMMKMKMRLARHQNRRWLRVIVDGAENGGEFTWEQKKAVRDAVLRGFGHQRDAVECLSFFGYVRKGERFVYEDFYLEGRQYPPLEDGMDMNTMDKDLFAHLYYYLVVVKRKRAAQKAKITREANRAACALPTPVMGVAAEEERDTEE